MSATLIFFANRIKFELSTMLLRSIFNVLVEYCEISSLHGLPLVVAKNRHFLERIFWIINVILAVAGVVGLCLSNWQRYVENPTVVSLEKDFRNWHNPFPAATGCFIERADEDLMNRYIEKKWKIDDSHEKYSYYTDFIKAVVNVSYESMFNFSQFKGDQTLEGIDLLDLSIQVHPELTGDLVTFDVKRKSNWDIIITEFGLCFTTNSKFTDIFVAKKTNKTKTDDFLLECHYLNGLCYARYDSDPYLAIKYFVHSPYEVIHTTTTPFLLLPEKAELEINYRMQETRPATTLRRLSVSQRNCRFSDEPLTSDFPVYSTSICHIMCRYRRALRVCGCKPFFYPHLGGKTCDVEGMICLSKHVEFFTQNSNKMGCNCLEPCRVITYFPQAAKMTEWVSGYFDQRVTFRWGLLHPTTRFHRDVLFGFEDLVVSFGGTASLFFGMSFLSIVELIFFIIKKIIRKIVEYRGRNTVVNVNEPVQYEPRMLAQARNFERGNRNIERPTRNFVNVKPIEENIEEFDDDVDYGFGRNIRDSYRNSYPYHSKEY